MDGGNISVIKIRFPCLRDFEGRNATYQGGEAVRRLESRMPLCEMCICLSVKKKGCWVCV